jgi:transcriptional regulator with XRE-family HTH domain
MRFDRSLKEWRKRRGFSQERLGFEARVSTRHIAFMETGRAQPSREMVIRLSEALDVPRNERNHLLEAAGYAALYLARPIEAADTAHIVSGVKWMLERHEPFPAFAIDRHWKILLQNRVAEVLFGQLGLKIGDSILDAVLQPLGLRQVIVNWTEMARYIAKRLSTEARALGGDVVLSHVADQLLSEVGFGEQINAPFPAVLQTHYRIAGLDLSLFSTIAQFGSADDLTLANIRIEYLFPADALTRLQLEQLANNINRQDA